MLVTHVLSFLFRQEEPIGVLAGKSPCALKQLCRDVMAGSFLAQLWGLHMMTKLSMAETKCSMPDSGVVLVLLSFTCVTSFRIAFILKALHRQADTQVGNMIKEKYITYISPGKAQEFYF